MQKYQRTSSPSEGLLVRARYLRRAAQCSIASSSLAMLDGVFRSESGEAPSGWGAWLVDASSPGEVLRAQLSSGLAMRAGSNSGAPAREGGGGGTGVRRRGGSPRSPWVGRKEGTGRDGSGWFLPV